MGAPTVSRELFEGDALDSRSNWTDLPCPDCGKMPIAVLFGYDDSDLFILDATRLDTCRVKDNLVYVHAGGTPREELVYQSRTCPECGYRPRRDEELESTNAGVHADQIKILCPECGERSWGQGWSLDG